MMIQEQIIEWFNCEETLEGKERVIKEMKKVVKGLEKELKEWIEDGGYY